MEELFPGTCVAPSGTFVYGIHKQKFTATNLRETDHTVTLGCTRNQEETISNVLNFPEGDVCVSKGAWIFEIPNAFPFLGATFIVKTQADRTAGGCNPFVDLLKRPRERGEQSDLKEMSRASLLSLAASSTEPKLLAALAEQSCQFVFDDTGTVPIGRVYRRDSEGRLHPSVSDYHLYQLVSNNPFLPDDYKRQMVLIPGVQGRSSIVGEYSKDNTHIWEYLRENSYIPWGHYAANMAHDSVRYTMKSLKARDVSGLRHLYYQRMYVQLARELGLPFPASRRIISKDDLERLRVSLLSEIGKRTLKGNKIPYSAIIWGQNFGFDLSASGYRLGGSHQQIHQQFALVPSGMAVFAGGENVVPVSTMPTYAQGDRIAQFSQQYRQETGQPFFATYLEAIQSNRRLDGRSDQENRLTVFQDDNLIVFVPKAQRSQGEVHIMTTGTCGNILEADTGVRDSLDRAIVLTMKSLENLGVEMFTGFELSKRLDNTDPDQRLLYCFFPRHPRSPGGFSEFQQRWISNHYPEDFAKVCREQVDQIIAHQNTAPRKQDIT